MTTLKANGTHPWGAVEAHDVEGVPRFALTQLGDDEDTGEECVVLDRDQEEALRNLLNARALAAVEALPKPRQPGELRVGDRVRVRADRTCEVHDCPLCEGRPVLLVEKLLSDGAPSGGPAVRVTGGYSVALSFLEHVP